MLTKPKNQGVYIMFIHIQSPLKASGLTEIFLCWIKHFIVMHVIPINIWHLWLWFLLPCLLTVMAWGAWHIGEECHLIAVPSTQYHFSKLLHTTSQWESTKLGAPSCSLHGVSATQIAIQRLMNTEANGRHSRRNLVCHFVATTFSLLEMKTFCCNIHLLRTQKNGV